MDPVRKWVIEGPAYVTFEDSDQACIAEISGDDHADNGIFVRFHSWQDRGRRGDHPMMDLHGRRMRVEITVVEDA